MPPGYRFPGFLSRLLAPASFAQGGGIYNAGSLTVGNSVLYSNSASGSATFYQGLPGFVGDTFNAGQGGGIHNVGLLR